MKNAKLVNRLSAIAILVLVAVVLVGSVLPIFTVDVSTLDDLVSYDTTDGYLFESESFRIVFDKEADVGLLTLLPLATDFSRVSIVFRCVILDMNIKSTTEELTANVEKLLTLDEDSQAAKDLLKENQELSFELAEKTEERELILSTLSDEELDALNRDLADPESELNRALSVLIISFVAASTASPIGLNDWAELYSPEKELVSVAWVFLVLAIAVFLVITLVVTQVRFICFIVYFIKGLVQLGCGFGSAEGTLVQKVVPKGLKRFASFTILEVLLVSLLGGAAVRGASGILVLVALLLISVIAGVAQTVTAEGTDRSRWLRRCLAMALACILFVAILLAGAAMTDLTSYIADGSFETAEAGASSYLIQLIVTVVVELILLSILFKRFIGACDTLSSADAVLAQKGKGASLVASLAVLVVFAIVSLFFLAAEVLVLVMSVLALGIAITILVLNLNQPAEVPAPTQAEVE